MSCCSVVGSARTGFQAHCAWSEFYSSALAGFSDALARGSHSETHQLQFLLS